ncbi:hypothetical protein BURMUCGD1_4708 [Burkholderia multivorans CGD1]|nr:hypothetical protein BURMUCGD1_4708 [Burkholderia multivorans CGD1]
MADGVGTDMGDDGTGHVGARIDGLGHARRAGQARARMRRASVDRYLIGVRPVLINVFIGDLVEVYGARDRRTAMTPESAV